ADLTVVATNGDFDEDLYPLIARTRGVSIASPELRVEANLADRRGTIAFLGIDAFRYRALQPAFASAAEADPTNRTLFDPRTILLSTAAAQTLELGEGDELRVQLGLDVVTFEIGGVLPAEAIREPIALIDIAT